MTTATETTTTTTPDVSHGEYTAKFCERYSRFPGDKLAYDLWHVFRGEELVGSISDASYTPRFSCNLYRLRVRHKGLLEDTFSPGSIGYGIAFDSGPVGTLEETLAEFAKRADKLLKFVGAY
jgi:hypothetical protein